MTSLNGIPYKKTEIKNIPFQVLKLSCLLTRIFQILEIESPTESSQQTVLKSQMSLVQTLQFYCT